MRIENRTLRQRFDELENDLAEIKLAVVSLTTIAETVDNVVSAATSSQG